jgi:TPR repeat protein
LFAGGAYAQAVIVQKLAAQAPAADAPPAPSRVKLRALLDAGEFAQLDAELSAYQTAYRNGLINDEAAAKAFNALQRSDPDLRPLYDKWVEQIPQSYVARVARGYYLMMLGYSARGSGYSSETTQAQFGDMRVLFRAAQTDLETSLKLDAKPTLTYRTMMAMGRALGARERIVEYYKAAIALDPRVYTARASYLIALRPEWGGSLEQMEAAHASWKSALTDAQFQRLARMVEDARVRSALAPAQALLDQKRYQEAIPLCDRVLAQTSSARAHAMRGYGYALLNQYDKAIRDYSRALEIDPDGECCSDVRVSRASAFLKTGAKAEALADLTEAAADDNERAARELGLIHIMGRHGFKPDYQQGREWCEFAAKRGDGMSMYCMGSLYHGGLGVTKDPARAAHWFERAARRGVADAQTDLAYMLWNGAGIAQNRDQAVVWWRAAIQQNNARARSQLESHLSWWDYFRRVIVADFIDGLKERYRLFLIVLQG